MVAYGILITLVVLKYTLPNRGFYTSYSYNYASLCVAGVCITVLCIRGGIFAARIIANVRQGNHWCVPLPRPLRTAAAKQAFADEQVTSQELDTCSSCMVAHCELRPHAAGTQAVQTWPEDSAVTVRMVPDIILEDPAGQVWGSWTV